MNNPWPLDIIEDDFRVFRSKGIGSSDMPVIMGMSPYKTPYQLWLEKTNIKPSTFEGNYATQRGKDLEPIVRDWYNKETGSNMTAKRKVDSEFDYFRANADGVDHAKERMIEIKCGNLEDHESGKVPAKYFPQCVFLSIIFGYPIDYVSYNERSKEPFKIIEVTFSYEEVIDLMTKAHEFWAMVQSKTPPPFIDNDVIEINDAETEELVVMYGELKERSDADIAQMKSVKQKLSERIPHKKSSCAGYRMTWSERKDKRIFMIKRGLDEGI